MGRGACLDLRFCHEAQTYASWVRPCIIISPCSLISTWSFYHWHELDCKLRKSHVSGRGIGWDGIKEKQVIITVKTVFFAESTILFYTILLLYPEAGVVTSTTWHDVMNEESEWLFFVSQSPVVAMMCMDKFKYFIMMRNTGEISDSLAASDDSHVMILMMLLTTVSIWWSDFDLFLVVVMLPMEYLWINN